MKMGIVALAVILTLIFLLAAFNFYLKDNISVIITYVENANDNIKADNYDAAYESYKKAEKLWGEKEKIFALHLEHSQIDEVSELFVELGANFSTRNFSVSSKTCYMLVYSLEHIIEKNKVNFETIL